MKKLMFAAAAALCATAGFCVESANIVGYQTKDVRQNLSVQLPTFEDVSAAGVDIQSITPVAAAGETIESGDFVIQFYDQYGVISSSYMYVLGEDIDEGYADGWYEEDWETLAVKTFDVGEAFNVLASKGGSLQYAGQVVGEEVSVPVRQNLSAQGNFRPTAVNIQTITPVPNEGDEIESGDFVIQFYDQYGIISSSYMYVLGEDIDEGYADGWYEEDWETIADKTFEAGEGFNVLAVKGGYLKFPAL